MAQDNPLTALEENDKKARKKDNKPVDEFSGQCPAKTENIIVIGSELSYDSFWWKMMFMTPGVSTAMGSKVPPFWQLADKTTVLYVPTGYVKSELLSLEYLKDNMNVNLVPIQSIAEFNKYLSIREIDGEKYGILGLVFYAHGLHYGLELNYQKRPDEMLLDSSSIKALSSDLFATNGRIYSYACRTGVSVDGEDFASLDNAKPENSLAQAMANHFNVKVHAFYTRTLFRECIRDPKDSETIANSLKEKRKEAEGSVISISDEHEGLPHSGQGLRHHIAGYMKTDIPFVDTGQEKEGTSEYSLWRKAGARYLPVAASSPKGLPKDMIVFEAE